VTLNSEICGLQDNVATEHALRALGVQSGYLNSEMENCVTVAEDVGHGHQSIPVSTEREDVQEQLLQSTQLQNEACSVSHSLVLLYRHRMTILMPAFIAMVAFGVTGLALGDTIPIMALVVCLPTIIAFLAHWKCLTSDGAAYPAKWIISFAVYFVCVFSISLCNLLLSPARFLHPLGKWVYSFQAAWAIFGGVTIISLLLYRFNQTYLSFKKPTFLFKFFLCCGAAFFIFWIVWVLFGTYTFVSSREFLVICSIDVLHSYSKIPN
jgi:hypothetical protein